MQSILIEKLGINNGDALFFICDNNKKATNFSGLVRTKLAKELELIKDNEFKFCWIVDFPMYLSLIHI